MSRAGRLILCISLAIATYTAAARAQVPATTAPVIDVVDEQIGAVPTDEMERFLASLDPTARDVLPPFDLRSLVRDPAGHGVRVDFSQLLAWGGRLLLGEIAESTRLLLQLIILAVASALLKALAGSLGGKDVTDVAFMVSLLALLLLGVQAFRTVVDLADGAITQMVSFMHAVVPLLTTLLVAVGGVTSAAVFHPLLISVAVVVGTVVRTVILPLAFAGVVITLISQFSDEATVGRLGGLIHKASTTLLGIVFIVFLGVSAMRGALGPVVDGLGIRTAKFLTGTFVPVIGGRLADAMDVVVGGSLLIKNAVGAFGMLVVFVITALPALKIFSLLIIFRAATVCIEPIADEIFVRAVSSLGDGVALVLSCVLTAALMFFLSVTALVALGNLTVVMR